MSEPGSTTILTMAPDGTDRQWLGHKGPVTPPVYSHTYPGGCAQLTCSLMLGSAERIPATNPGRILQAYRGTSKVWDGKVDEPQASDQNGWAVSAHGCGTFGADFLAVWTSWTPDNLLTQGTSRGLRWRRPAAGVPSTGLWLSQPQNTGSQTIADAYNAMTSLGAYGWTVDRRLLQVNLAPLPSAVDRLLICTIPGNRTITADVNAILVHYCSADDGQGNQTFAALFVVNAAGVAKHGRMEAYLDLQDAGVMTSTAAQAAGNAILARYVRAPWAGPIPVQQGQILTLGGSPVDIGTEEAGHVYRVLFMDGGAGGEVTAAPTTIIGGGIQWDDGAEVGSLIPLGSIADDLSSLMGALNTAITPVAATTS